MQERLSLTHFCLAGTYHAMTICPKSMCPWTFVLRRYSFWTIHFLDDTILDNASFWQQLLGEYVLKLQYVPLNDVPRPSLLYYKNWDRGTAVLSAHGFRNYYARSAPCCEGSFGADCVLVLLRTSFLLSPRLTLQVSCKHSWNDDGRDKSFRDALHKLSRPRDVRIVQGTQHRWDPSFKNKRSGTHRPGTD